MDASPQGFFVAVVVAALLWGFQEDVYRQLLLGVPLAREEAAFHITSLEEFNRHGTTSIKFDGPCSVSRATDPTAVEPMPIVIVYKDADVTTLRQTGSASAVVRHLCIRAVTELVFHVLQGAVDLESLTPKVVSLIRDIY